MLLLVQISVQAESVTPKFVWFTTLLILLILKFFLQATVSQSFPNLPDFAN